MKRKILSALLVTAMLMVIIFAFASCTTQPETEPVVNEDYANAKILFLDYTVRYTSSSGNKEFIVIGYTMPNDNVLKTTNIYIDHVVFVKENIAEIRHIKNESATTAYGNYLYINEAKFIELIK